MTVTVVEKLFFDVEKMDVGDVCMKVERVEVESLGSWGWKLLKMEDGKQYDCFII